MQPQRKFKKKKGPLELTPPNRTLDGCIVVPASLAHLLASFTEDGRGTIEEAESRAEYGDKPFKKYGETEKLAEVLSDKAQRGNTILVPITDGTHWIFLSASRKTN